jgi:alpha-N-arabinofuranosidase
MILLSNPYIFGAIMTSQIIIDRERVLSAIDPKLFGGFLEHMGRAIYEGIYEPDSPLSDKRGFRMDTMKALQELNPTIVRYPGGNFLSGYHWLDGVGPRQQRPTRRDLAWRSIETNQFGTDEFMQYCDELKTQPMLGVNLGTGTIEEASGLVEYCNAPAGTAYADLRVRNGQASPYGVKYWCLGNEMDGPWQIGHLEAVEYAQKAREAAKMMKWQDPTIQLIVCGSSSVSMPTYPEWDRIALETCWEHVDYLSLHYYAGNRDGDTASYLALASQFESHLDTLAGTLRYVKAKLRSKHDVFLSWDEWNVWYKDMNWDGGGKQAPHLIEEVYNLEDALVVAQWLNVFLRRSQVLKVACLAQLVNVIAPILTRKDGLLKQSIFYPFQMFRKHACGDSLDVLVKAPLEETKAFGAVPRLDVSASHDPLTGKRAVFVVNRSLIQAEPLELLWQGWKAGGKANAWQMSGSDPKMANTFEQPDRVTPMNLGELPMDDGRINMTLPPLSFTMVVVE